MGTPSRLDSGLSKDHLFLGEREDGPVTTESKDEAHRNVVQHVGTSPSNVTYGDGMVDYWVCGW